MVNFPEELNFDEALRTRHAKKILCEMARKSGDIEALGKYMRELAAAEGDLAEARAMLRDRTADRRALKALTRMRGVNACQFYRRLPPEQQFLGAT